MPKFAILGCFSSFNEALDLAKFWAKMTHNELKEELDMQLE
jgi:hypothetical protein